MLSIKSSLSFRWKENFLLLFLYCFLIFLDRLFFVFVVVVVVDDVVDGSFCRCVTCGVGLFGWGVFGCVVFEFSALKVGPKV